MGSARGMRLFNYDRDPAHPANTRKQNCAPSLAHNLGRPASQLTTDWGMKGAVNSPLSTDKTSALFIIMIIKSNTLSDQETYRLQKCGNMLRPIEFSK